MANNEMQTEYLNDNVLTYEAFSSDPCDPKWYWDAFNWFRESGEVLQYAASYHIPEVLLDDYK